jgi:hypothetical protein
MMSKDMQTATGIKTLVRRLIFDMHRNRLIKDEFHAGSFRCVNAPVAQHRPEQLFSRKTVQFPYQQDVDWQFGNHRE